LSLMSLLILFGLTIALAAFSNWARLTFLSLSPSQLRNLFGHRKEHEPDEGHPKKAEGFLLSVLISADLAMAAAPLLAFACLSRIAPDMAIAWRAVLALFTGAVFLLVFSEVLPRVLLNSPREPSMRFALIPLSLLRWALLPVRITLQRVSLLLGKLLGRDLSGLGSWSLWTGLPTKWNVEGREEQLEEEEKVLISSIYDMTETIVREVMVPRLDMHCLEQDMSLAQVRQRILSTGHSRFPVYADNIDNMVGLFLSKDLLRYSSREKLARGKARDIMHPIAFVPETKNVTDLLRECQHTRRHLMIVVDEYGGTAGLVTIEDLLEEIVGDIQDEFDREPKLFVKTKEGAYLVDAKMSISDLEEEVGMKLPEDSEYDTIGGFVVATLGKVPQRGEAFESSGVSLTVLEADERRVHRVKLLPVDKEEGSLPEKKGEKE
jgi:putative hemolysin